MTFDTTRFTFNPWNNYNGVVMEQGRVQLDSDWNEWLAELERRLQAGTLDVFGYGNPPHCAVYPATTPYAFQITVTTDSNGVNHVMIGPGRMYVDGIQAENHGTPASANWSLTWDPALAEMSNTPQPPPAALPAGSAIDYLQQPYYPVTALPTGNGPFLAYLDVWKRAVTYLEDGNLIDPAVNVDTTGRLQTIWQVKLVSVPSGSTCSGVASNPPWPGPSVGQLSNGHFPSGASGPCCLTSGSGYTGLENQNYRVQIHQSGYSATSSAAAQTGHSMATFKWSRDNGSVQTGVTGIQTVTNSLNNNAAQLTVTSLGRDQTLGFAPGNWIELIDDNLEFLGQPGELHLIDTVDFASKTITLVDQLKNASNFPVDTSNNYATIPSRHTRIVRWDQSGQVYLATPTSTNPNATTPWYDLGANGAAGDIPVPPEGSSLILESGITVTFGPSNSTQFNTADYWSFAARGSNGQIDQLVNAAPFGIHHHYAPLAVVSFSPISYPDCRLEWPPAAGSSSCGCCNTYTVGANGDYSTIQAAVNALPTTGGEIQILPGIYYENVFIEGMLDVVIRGCGEQTRVASAVLAAGATEPPAQNVPASAMINAVFSISTSRHIKFLNFVVEAANNEAGILLDGVGYLIGNEPSPPPAAPNAPTGFQAKVEANAKAKAEAKPGANAGAKPNADLNAGTRVPPNSIDIIAGEYELGLIDIGIEKMVITASNMPAIFAKRVSELRICDCRLAMENVNSTYAAVWMSGENIVFARNWVGLQITKNIETYLPAVVAADLGSQGPSLNSGENTRHPGGIQIGGNSSNVQIIENQIVGGLRNAITLGSYLILDANGNAQPNTPGVTITVSESQEVTLVAPSTFPGVPSSTVVSAGKLGNINIKDNEIANFGLAGIGPVAFFDLTKTLEIVASDLVRITGNTIGNTVQLIKAASTSEFIAHGAITLASAEDLVICDNIISQFGYQPGLGVAGIYLLHGEVVEISRNQIIDNRDWNDSSTPDQAGNSDQQVGAIDVVIATPPTLPSGSQNLFGQLSVFEPGLPALRIQNNLVRVPLGSALFALGLGPFEINDNHFSCGGNIPGTANSDLLCVFVINLGYAIELISPTAPSQAFSNATGMTPAFSGNSGISSSSGAVLFSDNMCQLELREVPQTGFASVLMISLDHLIFSNNHCWVDGAGLTAAGAQAAAGTSVFTDAFLVAGSLNVTGNRFQEGQGTADLSAWTIGLMNITSQNISTYCILAQGSLLINNNNLSVVGSIAPGLCEKLLSH
jgi:hypothetical protein